MFLGWEGLAFVLEHLESGDEPRSGLAGLDHIVDVSEAGGHVRMAEGVLVLLDQTGPEPVGVLGLGRALVVGVEGAVGMVEMALELLSQKHVVELDEERKAAMVSNLLVVLCSDRHTQPVVNTGTLYN